MKLSKVISVLLRLISITLVSFIPKKNNIWVFGSWFGKKFADNPKWLYLHVREKHPNIKCIWITKDMKLLSTLRRDGIDAEYAYSFNGIWLQMRAGFVFVSHAIHSDLNTFAVGIQTKRIQLWHGTPLKKIGFDDNIFTTPIASKIRTSRLFKILTNENYNLITASDDYCANCFSSAFNEPLEKIIKTGFPRNDVFLKKNICSEGVIKAIYMPTFRGNVGDDFDLFTKYGFDAELVDNKLHKNNVHLYIRTHPVNKPTDQMLNKIKACKNIHVSNIDDIYEEISDYQFLITDYSSILFDFSLLGREIIFAPFDYEEYLSKNRDLYLDYFEFIDNKYCRDWSDVIDQLVNNSYSVNGKNTELDDIQLHMETASSKISSFLLNSYMS